MDWGLFLTFLAACMAAATTGAMIKPGAWYDSLRKPAWTPPNWVFPVTWFVLYIAMSWSAARIAVLPDSGQALAFWGLQIALNTLWTPIFFGQQKLRAGMVIITCLWLSVAATTVAFLQLDVWAGLAFVPYLIWTSIASALNFRVWRMNPQEA
ncbi:TspO/MBR family protein [Paracoccaceae bacterium Fryx2]|nr:TspO/MBR family protein [Paracoccaceae bacterium Fryx2]